MFIAAFFETFAPVRGRSRLCSSASTATQKPAHIGSRPPPADRPERHLPFWQYQFYCGPRKELPKPLTYRDSGSSPGNRKTNHCGDRLFQLAELASRTALAIRSKSASSKSFASEQSCRANLCRAHSTVSGRPSAVQVAFGSSSNAPKSRYTSAVVENTSAATGQICPRQGSARHHRANRCRPTPLYTSSRAASLSKSVCALRRYSAVDKRDDVCRRRTNVDQECPRPLSRSDTQTPPPHANCWPPPKLATSCASPSGTSRPSTT